jgi:ABC-type phosphonate transport system ATPase subunit
VRLIAYAFSGATDPVVEGVLWLGELTAVLGPNDSGKSRLVRGFASALDGPQDGDGSPAAQGRNAAIYAALDEAEREDLLRTGTWQGEVLGPLRPAETRAEAWAGAVLENADTHRALLLDALLASCIFAFARPNTDGAAGGAFHRWSS